MGVDHNQVISDIADQVEATLRHHYDNQTREELGGSVSVVRTSSRQVEVHLSSGQRIRVEVV